MKNGNILITAIKEDKKSIFEADDPKYGIRKAGVLAAENDDLVGVEIYYNEINVIGEVDKFKIIKEDDIIATICKE